MKTLKQKPLTFSYGKSETPRLDNCWHFRISGFELAKDEGSDSEFGENMRSVCIVSHEYRVTVVAYGIVRGELHLILSGEQSACLAFAAYFVGQLSEGVGVKGVSGCRIPDEERLRNEICRMVKQARLEGNRRRSSDYAYFRGSRIDPTVTWRTRDTSYRSGTMPPDMHLDEKNRGGKSLFRPDSFVDADFVERLFGSYLSFEYKVRKN